MLTTLEFKINFKNDNKYKICKIHKESFHAKDNTDSK